MVAQLNQGSVGPAELEASEAQPPRVPVELPRRVPWGQMAWVELQPPEPEGWRCRVPVELRHRVPWGQMAWAELQPPVP